MSDIAPYTPIGDLPISVRAHNALRNEGCKTYADLCAIDLNDFSRAPNVGRKTIAELRKLQAGAVPIPKILEKREDFRKPANRPNPFPPASPKQMQRLVEVTRDWRDANDRYRQALLDLKAARASMAEKAGDIIKAEIGRGVMVSEVMSFVIYGELRIDEETGTLTKPAADIKELWPYIDAGKRIRKVKNGKDA